MEDVVRAYKFKNGCKVQLCRCYDGHHSQHYWVLWTKEGKRINCKNYEEAVKIAYGK